MQYYRECENEKKSLNKKGRRLEKLETRRNERKKIQGVKEEIEDTFSKK
jgi:hypothetical protein